jgi:hypothetical protein
MRWKSTRRRATSQLGEAEETKEAKPSTAAKVTANLKASRWARWVAFLSKQRKSVQKTSVFPTSRCHITQSSRSSVGDAAAAIDLKGQEQSCCLDIGLGIRQQQQGAVGSN